METDEFNEKELFPLKLKTYIPVIDEVFIAGNMKN